MLCIGRDDGKTLWRRDLHEALPHEGAHNTASLASASPITDGQRVFAFFGSHGLYCLKLDGTQVWEKQLGRMSSKHGHGEGASPALYKQTLIINWDHEGQSFVVALDKSTGRELWRVKRNEVTSWATPIVVEHEGRAQVIICGTDRVRAYDLKSGKVIWQCGGMSANIVATPVAGDGMVFAGSSYEKRALLAIRLKGASGDITDGNQIAWRRFRGTPYVPSPLLYDGGLYFLTHYQGILTRVNAKTGQDEPGAFRLSGIRNVYASPVAAAGRVYITDQEGATLVISAGTLTRALALNHLDDQFSASPVLVDQQLLLRGHNYLYCLEESTVAAGN
jgi:outer membrane protein assembly factor BamB